MSTASRHLAIAPKRRIRQPTVNFSNTLSDAPRFRGRPFPRGHSRSAMKTISDFPCPRHRAISQPHQSVAFASPPPTPQTPFPSPPRFRGRPFPRRHTRITKSHPESSAGSAHVPTPPCHANHGRRCRFHWHPFPASRIPAPTPKRRIRQFPANFSSTRPVAPLSRTALLRTDIRAAPWDPTEISVATAGHPLPRTSAAAPLPPRKKRAPGKARPPACGAIFPRPAAYCAFGVTSF